MKKLFCLVLACILLCACTAAPAETTVPETTSGPVLRPGFYVPTDEDAAMLMVYVELLPGGTGNISVMGVSQPDLSWTETGLDFYDVKAVPTADGFLLEDAEPMEFTYTGDSLPEGYLPDPPAPGIYCVSSVGYNGNTSFYGTYSRSNGYLELRGDGTGLLVFQETEWPLTWDGSQMVLKGGYSLMLMDMGEQGEDPRLVMAYVLEAECPLEADSIAFRLMEGE